MKRTLFRIHWCKGLDDLAIGYHASMARLDEGCEFALKRCQVSNFPQHLGKVLFGQHIHRGAVTTNIICKLQ